MPKVSIGVPVYNGERFLPRALDSILGQTESDLEVIICDNASTDQTMQIARDAAARDRRVIYIRNDTNIGAGPNFNLAFRRSRGRYFKWAAHDDWISPDYLAQCVQALDSNPQAVLAFGSTQSVDSDGKPIPLIGSEFDEREIALLGDGEAAVRFAAAVRSFFWCFEVFGLIRSSALRQTDLHEGYYGSDRALLVQLALLGTFVKVPGPVLYNRDHQSRSIRLANASERLSWQDVTRRSRSPLPVLRLCAHYASIIRRTAPAGSGLPCYRHLLAFMMQRYMLFKLGCNLIEVVSPKASGWLEDAAMKRNAQVRREPGPVTL